MNHQCRDSTKLTEVSSLLTDRGESSTEEMKTGNPVGRPKSQPNSTEQPEAKPPRRKRRTKAQILLDRGKARQQKGVKTRSLKTSPINIAINEECKRQLQKSRETDPDANKYANTSKRASEKKVEGPNKTRPKTPQIIVSDKAIADILRNSSAASNEEPVYTPTIIRKFRPPKSKYQLELEALQCNRNFSSSSEVSIASTSTSRRSPPYIPSPPVAHSPSVPEPGIFEPSKPVDDLVERDYPLLPPLPKIPSVSKYVYVNAWLAKKQATWCSKYTDVLHKMLKRDALIATYKCMVKSCSFTTTSPKNFEKHICLHEKSLLPKEFLYYCPYCFIVEYSAASLMAHYESHLKDKFSCSVCFYRSAEESSCYEHLKSHHSNRPPDIYECPLDVASATLDEMTTMKLKHRRKEFVAGIKCSGKFAKHLVIDPNVTISLFPACNVLFYLLDVYEAHMKEHRTKNDADVTADITSYKLNVMNNKVGMFQCLSCEFGTESRSESVCLKLINVI